MRRNAGLSAGFLSLLFCLCLAHIAGATYFYGVKGGLSYSSPSRTGEFAPGVEWSTRVSFGFGAQLEFPVARRIAILTEPMIVGRGMHVDWPGTEWDNTIKYTYVDIPLNLKLRFPTRSVDPYLFAGPYTSISLSQKSVMDKGGSTFELDDKTYDIGFTFGAGLAVPVSERLSWVFDARYTLGLVDINESGYGSTKNRAVLLLVGPRLSR